SSPTQTAASCLPHCDDVVAQLDSGSLVRYVHRVGVHIVGEAGSQGRMQMKRLLRLLLAAAAIFAIPAVIATKHDSPWVLGLPLGLVGLSGPSVAHACDYGDDSDCNPDDWCDAWSYDCEEDPDNCTDAYADQFIGDDE